MFLQKQYVANFNSDNLKPGTTKAMMFGVLGKVTLLKFHYKGWSQITDASLLPLNGAP